jgi:adenylate kinase family enzyme
VKRVVVIGNSGGGKSVLARRIADALRLPYVEIDALLWEPGWQLVPAETYEREHARVIAGDRWVIDGLGARSSVPQRLQRATHIVLIDMPLWTHFWLAAERHAAWTAGRLEHPPAGLAQPAPLKGLFQTIAEVDRDWMPGIRRLADEEQQRGKRVVRLATLEELNSFAPSVLETG